MGFIHPFPVIPFQDGLHFDGVLIMLVLTIDDGIVLPDETIALIPIVKTFQDADRSEKLGTEWFLLCSTMASLSNWNNRAFSGNRLNNLEFAALVARAYSGLFNLRKQDIPYCVPSSVVKTSKLAKEMIGLLPNNGLLPGNAQEPIFLQGLQAVSRWRPSDIPSGASGRGKPEARWLINKIAEEFCYSFDREPTVSIVGDIVRLGWTKLTDRSIRNTFTNELSLQALETARIRRDNDNKSKTITHQVISALPSASKGVVDNQTLVPCGMSDKRTLELMEAQANTLSDSPSKLRLISFIKVMQYEEQSYLDGHGN